MDRETEERKRIGGRHKKGILREYLEAAIIAVFLALFIRTFVIQAYKISQHSLWVIISW
jgi:signal peptidase I